MTETSQHRCGFVALAGPPNSGKSTLLNAYLGQKIAITSSKPQTTRNQIIGILTHPDRQIVFLDTPGLHAKRGLMNRMLMHAARQAIDAADVILLILDANRYAGKPQLMETALPHLLGPLSGGAQRPLLIAANKVDVVKDKKALLPVLDRLHRQWPQAELFPISALREDGLQELLTAITRLLPIAEPLYPEDQVSTAPMRFMAAELVREKLFSHLKEELPYSIGVDIDTWEEHPEKLLTSIHATIYVARGSHKSIVIGKGGNLLKTVGTLARLELEEMLEHRVHLELWVKVREDWTEDPAFLRQLGLSS